MRTAAFAAFLLALTACKNGPFPEGTTPSDSLSESEAAAAPLEPLKESPAGRALVAGETQFSAALFRQVSASPGSVVVSPYGVFAALGMAREGARGTTAKALDTVLGLGGEPADGWTWFYDGLRSAKTLRSASAVWIMRRIPPAEEFLAILSKRHGAQLETFDAAQPAATAADVNAWASKHTEGRIKEILTPGDVGPLLRLLLTNAVYFHDRWAAEFPRGATRDEDFHVEPGRNLRVPMMHQRSHFDFATIDAARVLALPHRGGATELLVVLPAEGRTLPEVEAELGKGALAAWGEQKDPVDVILSLPRFRVESNHSLVAAMTALGAGVAFENGADLTGVGIHDPLGPLFISDLRQRALLECDEEGTTAAAVTSLGMSCSAPPGPPPPPVVFRCDRPFLFVLRHVPTGTILFVGRYAG